MLQRKPHEFNGMYIFADCQPATVAESIYLDEKKEKKALSR